MCLIVVFLNMLNKSVFKSVYLQIFHVFKAKSAREKFQEVVSGKPSADELVAVTKSVGQLMATMDDHWGIESGLLRSIAGASAEGRAAAAVVAELPSAERSVTIAQAKARLDAMQIAQAFKLSPLGVQASVGMICRVLGSLSMGVAVDERPEQCSSLVRSPFCPVRVVHGVPHMQKVGGAWQTRL